MAFTAAQFSDALKVGDTVMVGTAGTTACHCRPEKGNHYEQL